LRLELQGNVDLKFEISNPKSGHQIGGWQSRDAAKDLLLELAVAMFLDSDLRNVSESE
jgi:hypothetical protein